MKKGRKPLDHLHSRRWEQAQRTHGGRHDRRDRDGGKREGTSSRRGYIAEPAGGKRPKQLLKHALRLQAIGQPHDWEHKFRYLSEGDILRGYQNAMTVNYEKVFAGKKDM